MDIIKLTTKMLYNEHYYTGHFKIKEQIVYVYYLKPISRKSLINMARDRASKE